MFNGNTPSLSDIAAVVDNNGNNNGFGGDGWWALIILLALFGGFNGNNGFGGSNGGYSEVQRGFDTQTVVNKLNGLENGLCGLGYDQLAQMNSLQTALMQNTNALATQLASCCCENRQAISQVRYDMATDTCAITNAINQMGQNIIQNDNANYRQLHDEFVQFQMGAKEERIAQLQAQVNALQLAASQQAQNNFLVEQLRPCPSPAYVVPNPYCPQVGYNCYNNNNNCC